MFQNRYVSGQPKIIIFWPDDRISASLENKLRMDAE